MWHGYPPCVLHETQDPLVCCLHFLQVKNSATRNLHRLAAAILFVKVLFEKLLQTATAAGAAHTEGSAAAAAVTLREAACAAYEEALAPIHTTIVRVSWLC